MRKGDKIDETDNLDRSAFCTLTSLMTTIMDKTIRDLQDYCEKDDKTGNNLTKRGQL